MQKAMKAIWAYFKDMNSEKDGSVSIKRNTAWGIASLMVFVQVFGLIALYYLIIKHDGQETLVTVFKYALTLFTVTDGAMILLILQITSVEKLRSLAQTILTRAKEAPAPEATESTTEDAKSP